MYLGQYYQVFIFLGQLGLILFISVFVFLGNFFGNFLTLTLHTMYIYIYVQYNMNIINILYECIYHNQPNLRHYIILYFAQKIKVDRRAPSSL